jgi:3-dehydroquinate dehydratase-2
MAKGRPNILILNGPNLNMLGMREPDIYGFKTLAAIGMACEEYAAELGFAVDFRQTNSEGDMVTILQEAQDAYAGIVINAGAYSHTSVAIHDAVKMLDIPVIEVHLSNVFKRESFRHHSYIAPVAQGVICGFGGHGYMLALDALRACLDEA